ncbi:MAG: hypothetical protein WD971_04725, partial [Pirellulales bacterium]
SGHTGRVGYVAGATSKSSGEAPAMRPIIPTRSAVRRRRKDRTRTAESARGIEIAAGAEWHLTVGWLRSIADAADVPYMFSC